MSINQSVRKSRREPIIHHTRPSNRAIAFASLRSVERANLTRRQRTGSGKDLGDLVTGDRDGGNLAAFDRGEELREVDDFGAGLELGRKVPDEDRDNGHDHPEHQATKR